MPKTITVLLERRFLLGPCIVVIKKEFSRESAIEFRSSKWAVTRELGYVREAKKMALWVQVWSLNQRATALPRKLKNLPCLKSVSRKRLVGSVIDWGLWTVKCSSQWRVVYTSGQYLKLTNPCPVCSQTLLNTWHNVVVSSPDCRENSWHEDR
jgi:hypothetical protein